MVEVKSDYFQILLFANAIGSSILGTLDAEYNPALSMADNIISMIAVCVTSYKIQIIIIITKPQEKTLYIPFTQVKLLVT